VSKRLIGLKIYLPPVPDLRIVHGLDARVVCRSERGKVDHDVGVRVLLHGVLHVLVDGHENLLVAPVKVLLGVAANHRVDHARHAGLLAKEWDSTNWATYILRHSAIFNADRRNNSSRCLLRRLPRPQDAGTPSNSTRSTYHFGGPFSKFYPGTSVMK
jgi:hypothetical protein